MRLAAKLTLSFLFLSLFALSLFSGQVFAGEGAHLPPRSTPQFDKLKSLLSGRWEGKNTKAAAGEEKLTVDYQVTSGGSALVQRQFSGSPHEMVSVYTLDGDTIAMTHYCLIGNQPLLKLKEQKEGTYLFDFAGGTNIKEGDHHMHRLKLTVQDETHITEEWTSFDKGVEQDKTVFTYSKVPS